MNDITEFPTTDEHLERLVEQNTQAQLRDAYAKARAAWEAFPDKGAMTDAERLALVYQLVDLQLADYFAGHPFDDVQAMLPMLIGHVVSKKHRARYGVPPFPELAQWENAVPE